MFKIKCQKGTSLIEILVTLFIMAVGLLGLAAMQVNSLKNINNSQFRSLATAYAYDMAERMRSNSVGVSAGSYNNLTTSGAVLTTCTSVCNSANVALMDVYEWGEVISQGVVSGGLPSGVGTVNAGTVAGTFNITISWQEQERDSTGGIVSGASFTLAIQP